ncbi:MAG: mitochondrial fission ELM1 family protein [Alphaproteobacteria bacterium]
MAKRNSETLTCWVVTDGNPGMENQCLGLAAALGVTPVVKRVRNRLPWRWLLPRMWVCALCAPGPKGDRLEPPWPDLLIATGRQSVALSAAVRRASGGRTFTVQIQNPDIASGNFDVVVCPLHDGLAGENVIETLGAMSFVTKESLAQAKERFAPLLARLPRPLVACLVGGTNRAYRFTPHLAAQLADGLAQLSRRYGAGLAVTPSRRTGAEYEALLRDKLAPLGAEIWNGRGENPYLGYLAHADAIVVTSDSVNMVSEACATGKPVYVFELEGGSPKFRRFHDEMKRAGFTRPFDGTLSDWSHEPLDETKAVAAAIRERLSRHRARLKG